MITVTHLKKQFQKVEKQEKEQQRPTTQKDKTQVLYFQEISIEKQSNSLFISTESTPFYHEFSHSLRGLALGVFHPPQSLV